MKKSIIIILFKVSKNLIYFILYFKINEKKFENIDFHPEKIENMKY